MQQQAPATARPGLGEPLPFVRERGAIYLDYNATTPIWPEVADEMAPFLQSFGNPSSAHVFGQPVRRAAAGRAGRRCGAPGGGGSLSGLRCERQASALH